MKRSTALRRNALAALIITSTTFSVGCSGNRSSISSLNPFSRAAATPTTDTGTYAAKASESHAPAQLASFGSSTKAAFAKTTSAVTNLFSSKPEAESGNEISKVDPTSLNNTPASISPEIFVANGKLWESTGNIAKAMESYSKALGGKPDDVPALKAIAKLHYSQGNFDQSVEFFKRAIMVDPKDADAYSDCGLAFDKLNQKESAKKAILMALQLAPGSSRHANRLATLRFDEGDKAGALEVLVKNNKPAVANFNMAYLHYKSGQLEDAQKHLVETLKYEPLAESDESVKQAVDRSRQMLAQLTETPIGPDTAIAQQTTPGNQSPAAGPTNPYAAGTMNAAVRQAENFASAQIQNTNSGVQASTPPTYAISSQTPPKPNSGLPVSDNSTTPDAAAIKIASKPVEATISDKTPVYQASTAQSINTQPAAYTAPFTPGSTSNTGHYQPGVTTNIAPTTSAIGAAEAAISTPAPTSSATPPSTGFTLPPSLQSNP